MAVAALLVVAWRVGNSCGPFIPQAQFHGEHAPPDPANQFKQGRIGILRPSFRTKHLVVAYRYLTAAPLTDQEIDQITTVRL
jgi:hypothetical protein